MGEAAAPVNVSVADDSVMPLPPLLVYCAPVEETSVELPEAVTPSPVLPVMVPAPTLSVPPESVTPVVVGLDHRRGAAADRQRAARLRDARRRVVVDVDVTERAGAGREREAARAVALISTPVVRLRATVPPADDCVMPAAVAPLTMSDEPLNVAVAPPAALIATPLVPPLTVVDDAVNVPSETEMPTAFALSLPFVSVTTPMPDASLMPIVKPWMFTALSEEPSAPAFKRMPFNSVVAAVPSSSTLSTVLSPRDRYGRRAGVAVRVQDREALEGRARERDRARAAPS